MLCSHQYIEGAPINIELREVLRLQGYPGGSLPQKNEVQQLVESQIDSGYKLIQPRAVFSVSPSFLLSGGRIRLEEGEEFSIGKAAYNWTGLSYWALAICTIGQALEKEVSELFSSGEYAAAVALDSVGSVAVESVADYVNSKVCQQALDEGLELTPRISPGYGNWALEEQKLIFKLLTGEKIGVTLSERHIMKPRKSISFGIGIGRGLTIERGIGRCRHCDMINCPYRVT